MTYFLYRFSSYLSSIKMSSSLQQQDLVIFNDNSLFSDNLFQDYNSLSLITHVQGTSDPWLITGLIENLLVGSCYINHKTTGSFSVGSSYNIRSNPRSHVVFGSFINNAQFYNKSLVKYMKMDIINTTRNSCFKFVDLMDHTINNHTRPISEIFKPIHEQIKIVKSNSHTNDTHKKINIIIEAPEILLQMKEDASAIDLIRELHLLQKLGNVILSISSDEPLIDYSEFESDVSTKHAVLLSSLIHKSNLLISLRPLSTGRADDITGELKIHKACVGFEDIGLEIIEKSYLYNVNKESTVKLFFK